MLILLDRGFDFSDDNVQTIDVGSIGPNPRDCYVVGWETDYEREGVEYGKEVTEQERGNIAVQAVRTSAPGRNTAKRLSASKRERRWCAKVVEKRK